VIVGCAACYAAQFAEAAQAPFD